jgi:hypothetical protein
VQLTYNNFRQLTVEKQSHSGAVGGSTPSVQYAYDSGGSSSNEIRLNQLTYPNGRAVSYNFASGMDSILNRVTSISDTSATLASYTYLGLGTVIRITGPFGWGFQHSYVCFGGPNANCYSLFSNQGSLSSSGSSMGSNAGSSGFAGPYAPTTPGNCYQVLVTRSEASAYEQTGPAPLTDSLAFAAWDSNGREAVYVFDVVTATLRRMSSTDVDAGGPTWSASGRFL